MTVLPAAAVPVRFSALSLVMWSPATPLSFENELIVGAAGGCGVAIATAATEDAAPVFPAASVAAAVKLWLPVDRTEVVKLHVPFEPTAAVPILFVPSNTATVLPASAVPVRTSTCVLARVAAGVDAAIVGVDGATVSTVTASAVEAPLAPPDVVAVAVRV